MFTGIIEQIGKVHNAARVGSNLDLWIECNITDELKIDQSVAHNGVCLTVVEIQEGKYRVTAVEETLKKTNLNAINKGQLVNLERALKVGDRLDGHFVQGHVDSIGTCINKTEKDGSWLFSFRFPEEYAELIIEKGSICINGVSLTAFDVQKDTFTVTIIPYTFEHTNFKTLQVQDIVNLEFDVLGKYLLRTKKLAED